MPYPCDSSRILIPGVTTSPTSERECATTLTRRTVLIRYARDSEEGALSRPGIRIPEESTGGKAYPTTGVKLTSNLVQR